MRMSKVIQDQEEDIERLKHGLIESLKLQSHYAELLNMYDGGTRKQFHSIFDWLDRVKETNARTTVEHKTETSKVPTVQEGDSDR